jgi:hypothetical protein
MKSDGKLYGRNEQREERRNKARQGVGRKTEQDIRDKNKRYVETQERK